MVLELERTRIAPNQFLKNTQRFRFSIRVQGTRSYISHLLSQISLFHLIHNMPKGAAWKRHGDFPVKTDDISIFVLEINHNEIHPELLTLDSPGSLCFSCHINLLGIRYSLKKKLPLRRGAELYCLVVEVITSFYPVST